MSQYDAVAERYARLIAPKYAAIARVVADRTPLEPASRVVEVAAGTGALTRLLARHVVRQGSYVASDLSAPMLECARPTVDSRVRLLVADAACVPLPDGASDVVVSSLGPIQDSDDALAESFRLLRPGGRLVFAMWGEDYRERRLLDAARARIGMEAYPGNQVEEATRRVTATGFTSLRATTCRLPVVHQSVSAYRAYRAAFGAPPGFAPERVLVALDAIECEAAAYLDDQQRVRLDWEIVVVEARRPAA